MHILPLFLSTAKQQAHPDLMCIRTKVDGFEDSTEESVSYLFVRELLRRNIGRMHNGELVENLGSQDESHRLFALMGECLMIVMRLKFRCERKNFELP